MWLTGVERTRASFPAPPREAETPEEALALPTHTLAHLCGRRGHRPFGGNDGGTLSMFTIANFKMRVFERDREERRRHGR